MFISFKYKILPIIKNSVENLKEQLDKLSDRVMNEKDETQLNMYSNALKDIMQNVQRYALWIQEKHIKIVCFFFTKKYNRSIP